MPHHLTVRMDACRFYNLGEKIGLRIVRSAVLIPLPVHLRCIKTLLPVDLWLAPLISNRRAYCSICLPIAGPIDDGSDRPVIWLRARVNR